MKNSQANSLKKHMTDIAKEMAKPKVSVSTGLTTTGSNLQKNNPAFTSIITDHADSSQRGLFFFKTKHEKNHSQAAFRLRVY